MLTSIEAERVRKGLTKEELAKKLVQRIINNCYIKPMPRTLHRFHPFHTSSDKLQAHGLFRQNTCKFVLPIPVCY